jgi:hypothetical protein
MVIIQNIKLRIIVFLRNFYLKHEIIKNSVKSLYYIMCQYIIIHILYTLK